LKNKLKILQALLAQPQSKCLLLSTEEPALKLKIKQNKNKIEKNKIE
jgi:hypothetical protein